MTLEKVDFDKTNQFSKIFTDYINANDQLKPFYGNSPSIDSFQNQLQNKSFQTTHRKILSQALEKQYEGVDVSVNLIENIKALEEKETYTITTGHQLNIFTGPLYFIYKIVSVINTCTALKNKYPNYSFVPIYWMASEDHDFEEISHFRLNGKTMKWNTSQTGAVGRFDPKELQTLIDKAPAIPDFFAKAYAKNKTLAGAVREYVNELFGEYGLITLDGDDKSLKKLLAEVVFDDIKNHSANGLVNKQSENLETLGYKTQVYPREINFFYLKNNLRSRIVREGDSYKVLDSDLSFTQPEIEQELKDHPERFSPNVILRPLYQEMILPNLAYFGGPGELAYWFQLKDVFAHYQVSFPILMPRNFALVIPKHIKRKMDKAHIQLPDLFKPKHQLLKELAIAKSEHDLQLNGQKDSIVDLFEKIKSKAAKIDPTLAPHVEAQQTITANKLDNIQKKFIRAEKKNQSDRLRQVETVLDVLFPNENLQERTDNFLNFYLSNPNFIKELISNFEPFDFRFNVLIDD